MTEAVGHGLRIHPVSEELGGGVVAEVVEPERPLLPRCQVGPRCLGIRLVEFRQCRKFQAPAQPVEGLADRVGSRGRAPSGSELKMNESDDRATPATVASSSARACRAFSTTMA